MSTRTLYKFFEKNVKNILAYYKKRLYYYRQVIVNKDAYLSGEMVNKLETILEEKGIKKSWLAKELGVSRQTITNWVKGYNYPDLLKLKKLSFILGVSIEEIFFNNKDYVLKDTDTKAS